MLSRREATLVVAGFVALTVALTWPQAAQLSTHIGWHYDAYFSVWRLAWVAHQLPRDPLHLFDANIFYPERFALTFSDGLILQGLLGAPLIWLGLSPVVVYNLLILLSFVTAGVSMYLLTRALGAPVTGAWVAGIVFAFQPYRLAHFPQIELLWTCWIPLAFLALHRAMAVPTAKAGRWIGLCVALQALSCLYYSVFLATALAILAVILVIGRSRAEIVAMIKPGVAAVVTAVVILAPYAAVYVAGRQSVGVRRAEDVARWSPRLVNYVTAPWENWLYDPPPVPDLDLLEGVLFPGVMAVVLAIAGVLSVTPGLKSRRAEPPSSLTPRSEFRSSEIVAYAVLLIVAFDVSLGFNGWSYRLLFEWVPPYDGLRVPGRMFVIVSAAMAVLGAFGVMSLQARLAARVRPTVVAAVVLGVVLLESVSVPVSLQKVITAPPKTYAWLASQPRAVVAEWPMPRPDNIGVTDAPRQMYFSTWHWQPLVNGYSGFYPKSHTDFLHRNELFPDARAVAEMRRVGVTFVVLHSKLDPEGYKGLRRTLGSHADFELMFTEELDAEEMALYRLRKQDRPLAAAQP